MKHDWLIPSALVILLVIVAIAASVAGISPGSSRDQIAMLRFHLIAKGDAVGQVYLNGIESQLEAEAESRAKAE